MKSTHVHNDHIYVLSNQIVAKNALFSKPYYSKRFLDKLTKYLSPLCEILSYGFFVDEFQLVVKLKSRPAFVKYYKTKKRRKRKGRIKKVPHSSYIFSQAMANLQSSMAIHFNRREKRSGALFARRYEKRLVESREKLEIWFERIKQRRRIRGYGKKWSSSRKMVGFKKSGVRKSGIFCDFYKDGFVDEGIGGEGLSDNCAFEINELQGHFKNLPPLSVSTQDLELFLEIRHKISIRKF